MFSAGVPRWFAVLGLLLGIAYALLMGPLRVPDETGHMYRSYLVSQGICKGVPAIGAPIDYRRDLARLYPWIQLPPNSTGQDLIKLIDPAHGRSRDLISIFYITNIYSCAPYLPQGIAFRLGRFFDASPLTLMYIGRLANLLCYLLLVLLAMYLLPQFELPIAVLALMPMSLHQAASLSGDSFAIGFSFALAAWLLSLAFDDPSRPLLRRQYLLLAAAMLLAGLCKSNAGLVLLLLVIPAARFASPRARWLTIAGCAALAYGTAALWQLINQPNTEIYSTMKLVWGVDLHENALAIFLNPLHFLHMFFRTIAWKTGKYMEQFIGVLGWLSIHLPRWCIVGYWILIAAVALATPAVPQLRPRARLILAATFFLNAALLLTAFWTTETPHKFPDLYVIVIHGRYLIPFALPLLIAGAGLAPRMRLLAPITLAFALAVNLTALQLVWNTYDAHTSTLANRVRMAAHLNFKTGPETAAQRYDSLLVRRPGDTPEDTKTYVVEGGHKHWILDGRWFPAHGYAWPDDVNLIPAPDLAAIPEGAPIQAP